MQGLKVLTFGAVLRVLDGLLRRPIAHERDARCGGSLQTAPSPCETCCEARRLCGGRERGAAGRRPLSSQRESAASSSAVSTGISRHPQHSCTWGRSSCCPGAPRTGRRRSRRLLLLQGKPAHEAHEVAWPVLAAEAPHRTLAADLRGHLWREGDGRGVVTRRLFRHLLTLHLSPHLLRLRCCHHLLLPPHLLRRGHSGSASLCALAHRRLPEPPLPLMSRQPHCAPAPLAHRSHCSRVLAASFDSSHAATAKITPLLWLRSTPGSSGGDS